jgi:gas vesicle protein
MLQEIRGVLNGQYKRRARIHTSVGVASGLVAGILLGGAAGILFAPKSGKETRADLREGGKICGENVKEAAQVVATATKQKVADVKSFVRKPDKKLDKIVEEMAEEI